MGTSKEEGRMAPRPPHLPQANQQDIDLAAEEVLLETIEKLSNQAIQNILEVSRERLSKDPSKEAENSMTALNGLRRNSIGSYDNNSDLTMI